MAHVGICPDVVDISDDDENEIGSGSGVEEELQAIESEIQQADVQIERLLARQQQLQTRRTVLLQRAETNRRAPRADWAGSFDWDKAALETLQNVFRLNLFRPQQREVINATMQGRDVLCLMPSGGGKSLCYQLPALLSGGCTLVVSPLLSLIQDQVFWLRQSGINALSLTSLTPKEEISEVYKTIDSDQDLRLLYVTPERILSAKRFMGKLEKLYKAGRLRRIAIDEAHCCSQWGNDFRPDYKKLGILKQQFPDVPILALTATATYRVRSDLQAILRIPECETFHTSVNRPNLFYEVRWKPATPAALIEDILSWIANHNLSSKSGIVYCLTRKDTEAVADQLLGSGIRAAHYHADMAAHTRQAVHQDWCQGKLQVIVATIAFGMGINKADVRFVIHHSLSKSIENYYQESGRAGRDGSPARCLIYYRPADLMRQAALVITEPGWDDHLFKMVAYVETLTSCRRSIISRHFAEAPASCMASCDICSALTRGTQRDISKEAQALVKMLSQLPGPDRRLTLLQLLDKWRGTKDSEERAIARATDKDTNERIIGRLLEAKILTLDFGFTAYATNTYIKISQSGMQGRGAVYMDFPEGCASANPEWPPKRLRTK